MRTKPGFEKATRPAERRDLFDVRRLLRDVARWGGRFIFGAADYQQGAVVTDNGWTMVCIAETGCTDKPAPTPIGSPKWLYS